MPRRPPFNEAQARQAIAAARCGTEALALLGYRNKGGNAETVKKHATRWGIATDHFDPRSVILEALERGRRNRRARTLDEILVEGSTYNRGRLKERLFEEGLKSRECELCGQGELWQGRAMSLILDHINGVSNDNRLDNLRIVCPNCAATLDTHWGRDLPRQRSCIACGETFTPRTIQHRYCSFRCFTARRVHDAAPRHLRARSPLPQEGRRKVERPSYLDLLFDLEETSYVAVARKYGVSDNAVRKWLAQYEREFELYEPSTDLAPATASSPPSRDRPGRSA